MRWMTPGGTVVGESSRRADPSAREELVLVVVPVPVKFALDDPEAHHGVVDGGQPLIEPRLARRDLGRDVDQLRRAVLVVEIRPDRASRASSSLICPRLVRGAYLSAAS